MKVLALKEKSLIIVLLLVLFDVFPPLYFPKWNSSCLPLLLSPFFNHSCHCLYLCQPFVSLSMCDPVFPSVMCQSIFSSCPLNHLLFTSKPPLASTVSIAQLSFSYLSGFTFDSAQTFSCSLFTHPLRFIPALGLFFTSLLLCGLSVGFFSQLCHPFLNHT